MDNKQPLLLSQGSGGHVNYYVNLRKTSLSVTFAKWILKIAMWVLFISWVALMFLFPSDFMQKLFNKSIQATQGTVFGITGSLFLVFSSPILTIALLSIAFLIISGEEQLHENKTSKCPSFRLWTFPVLVDGPFGVVSAAEFIGILLFVVYVFWAVYSYITSILSSMSDQLTFKVKSCLFLEILGLRLGSIGMFCLALLFLPVARGSVLLRLINIPFEHATRYHMLDWKDIGVANLPGLISLIAGLLMWVTSLPPVRKLNFELFFYTHQLYVIFVVFLALHVGDFIFTMAAGGIFIFILDRFLRFCQSRRVVDIISAKCLPCGTVELVCGTMPSVLFFFKFGNYHGCSGILSVFHPVLWMVLGKWTEKLRGNILENSEVEHQKELPWTPRAKITASVEGPYGHEIPYHLMYGNLILVAGGIGISPFLAVLSDILHCVREGRPCTPRNILIVWAVKRSDELPLLSTIDMESICPSFSNKLNIEIRIYVTRESEPPLEEGKVQNTLDFSLCPTSNRCGMSVLVGTGHNVWSGLYIISSTVGFVILMGLLDIFYINPFRISSWWYKGLLFIACMVFSVFIFGGLVVGLWHLWERRISEKEQFEDAKLNADKAGHGETVAHKDSHQKVLAKLTGIRYGARPNFKEIFESVSKNWGHVDVGVIVCGPPTLQSSVAKEIRSHNLRRQFDHPIFHFNSHSFDL
ncbi:hypothetical protein DVH24_033067 [Malus domestica]|uniref:ferric-chelate reductase (NADH) n=1 Tax=Malus domestica TaxID=3750 RepID=A0A498JFK1_MALDO|nr:hypothetical protein DVH24_033067 [Malus domestica]